MGDPKNSNWSLKSGWRCFKKMFTRPDMSLSIQNELLKLNSRLTLEHGFVIADMNRHLEIMTGFRDGSIIIDFWENGMCWHSAKTAYKLMVDNLPPDLGWAEYQTLEQYISRTQKNAS